MNENEVYFFNLVFVVLLFFIVLFSRSLTFYPPALIYKLIWYGFFSGGLPDGAAAAASNLNTLNWEHEVKNKFAYAHTFTIVHIRFLFHWIKNTGSLTQTHARTHKLSFKQCFPTVFEIAIVYVLHLFLSTSF